MAIVPLGDKMNFGQVPMTSILYDQIFETFSKDRKTSELLVNIILISINVREQKLYHKKLETKLGRQHKKICKKSKK